MFKFLLFIAASIALVQASCPNMCSGHGTCDKNDKCTCYLEKVSYRGRENDPVAGQAYAVDSLPDKSAYTGADCSLSTCPRGMSFTEIVEGADGVWDHKDSVECSDRGKCDRSTGLCECIDGWQGSACQMASCPNNGAQCSGHGICQNNLAFAVTGGARYLGAWDSGLWFGCACDAGYRGTDCSKKECPSREDPLEFEGAAAGRDCSGRGLCNYEDGICGCFAGFTGIACHKIEALV